ncbi:MAG: hypothetical protein KF764_15945 [Labilithrix sp.]|nr:hypothetical protein [Labilithrix sp.]MBX3221752.1 hypothetical protein [Labilithrix sp.]
MKLRIRGDSIRLRLSQGEVAALAEGGIVEESIGFGPDVALSYAIAFGGTTLSATLSGPRVEVSVPADVARAWAASDAVGLEGAQDIGQGRTLRILVEKDFACLTTRPHEDDADAFPNPKTSC